MTEVNSSKREPQAKKTPFVMHVPPLHASEIIDNPYAQQDILRVDGFIGRPIAAVSATPYAEVGIGIDLVIANFDPETMFEQPLLVTQFLARRWLKKGIVIEQLHFTPAFQDKVGELSLLRDEAIMNGKGSPVHQQYKRLFGEEVLNRLPK